jgi:hypothetical protein
MLRLALLDAYLRLRSMTLADLLGDLLRLIAISSLFRFDVTNYTRINDVNKIRGEYALHDDEISSLIAVELNLAFPNGAPDDLQPLKIAPGTDLRVIIVSFESTVQHEFVLSVQAV